MKAAIKDPSTDLTPQTDQIDFRAEIREQNDKLIEALQNSDYEKIAEVLNFIQKQITSIRQEIDKQISKNGLQLQKCVFLLGATGAGKSTLLNYLAGKQLVYKHEPIEASGGIRVKKFLAPVDSLIAAVGDGGGSTTYIPNIRILDPREFPDLTFIDFAGDFDNIGAVGEIINSEIRKLIANKLQKKAKFVVLCPQSNLRPECGYGKNLAEELKALSSFIGNLNEFKKHIALVISHCDNVDNAIDHIKTQITSCIKNTCKKYAGLLKHLTDNNQIEIFYKPNDPGKYDPLGQRDKLIQLINRVEFLDGKFNFNPSFSLVVNETIFKATEIIKDKIKETLKSEISNLIRKTFEDLKTSKGFANFIEEQIIAALAITQEKTIEDCINRLYDSLPEIKIDIKKFLESNKSLDCWTLCSSNPKNAKKELDELLPEIFEILRLHASNYKQYIEIKPDKVKDFKESLNQLVSKESLAQPVSKESILEYISKLNQNKFLPKIKTEKFTNLSLQLEEAKEIKNLEVDTKTFRNELEAIFKQITDDVDKVSDLFKFKQEGKEATYLGYCIKMSRAIARKFEEDFCYS